MLALELALAVAPTAVGDDGGDARVGAAGIDADRAAEARTDHADAVGVDVAVLGEKIKRVAGVLDLLEADDAAEFTLALAAAAHVEAQRHVAELVENLGGRDAGRARAVGAEAVQHQKRRAPLAGAQAVRHAQDAVQAQARGLKADDFFLHDITSLPGQIAGRHCNGSHE